MAPNANKEEFGEASNSGGNNLPSLETLIPGTKIYEFVSNPNVVLADNGDYIIDFSDPNFIPHGEYAGLKQDRDSDSLPIVIRVNFQNRTAFVLMGGMGVDQSRKYFPIKGNTP